MPKRSLAEQLDQWIETALAGEDAGLQGTDPRIAPLAGLATDLADLPSPNFKRRLKSDLERKVSMAATALTPFPKGYHTITPYLTVPLAAELIDFVKNAFGAEETFRTTGSAGGIHCEVRLGNSMVMIGGGAGRGTPMPTALHYYVPNVDEVYARALQLGAKERLGLKEDYGERFGCIEDLAGNEWYIATHQGASYVPEGLRDVTVYLHPAGARKLIDFMKRAFGAEEVAVYASEGVIHHAKMRIGDSIVEMGEAHGPWQPMPTMIYMYVPDVDAVYARALEAGATSISAPVDQPYGDRSGGVADAFGNQWYIATHIQDTQTT